jgi:hypothetical protein
MPPGSIWSGSNSTSNLLQLYSGKQVILPTVRFLIPGHGFQRGRPVGVSEVQQINFILVSCSLTQYKSDMACFEHSERERESSEFQTKQYSSTRN